jgi:16S rRNA (uracil1498-N3)-methyltransferase
MRRFFLAREAILSDKPTLTGTDVKHIRTVLRLKPGDEIFLFDGQGFDYRARIETMTQKVVNLRVLEQSPSVSESPVEITIGQALLKGKKMDRLVRQVTEMGIHALVPVIALRSVPKPGKERWLEREERWKAIARESLKQCGRFRAPHLKPPADLQEVVKASNAFDLKVIFHHDHVLSESDQALNHSGSVRTVLALVGPEGGFTPEEVVLAKKSEFFCVSLGPRILKADTAIVAACVLLQHVFGDMKPLLKKP